MGGRGASSGIGYEKGTRTESSDMIQYETDYGYFEKLKTQKDVRKFLKDKRDENGEFLPDEGAILYVEYKNGKHVIYDDADNISKMKYTGVERMVYSADYGETFYNAYPQMDINNHPDIPIIRIGAEPKTYGYAVDLEKFVK